MSDRNTRQWYVTRFGKMCIVHTSDFAHLDIHKTIGNGIQIRNFWDDTVYTPWKVHIYLSLELEFMSHQGWKLDVWTMCIFPNPVTYMDVPDITFWWLLKQAWTRLHGLFSSIVKYQYKLVYVITLHILLWQ